MVSRGKTDITVAYPALGRRRADKIAGLSQEHRVRVAVDSEYLMNSLSDAAIRHDALIGIHIMFDAGSKALSAKQLLRHETLEMGYIWEYPDARIFRLHGEHGWVDVDFFYLLTSGGRFKKKRWMPGGVMYDLCLPFHIQRPIRSPEIF